MAWLTGRDRGRRWGADGGDRRQGSAQNNSGNEHPPEITRGPSQSTAVVAHREHSSQSPESGGYLTDPEPP